MSRILVADDNSNIQKMVSSALKDQGIEVLGVSHGEAAVRKLPDFKPDLILADVFMPVRNGYELCEYVKNDERYAHIPVVLMVGAFDPLDQNEVKRVRADGLLNKPFEPIDRLMEMVRHMLQKGQQAKPAEAPPAPAPAAAAAPVGETMELSPDEMRELLRGKEEKKPEPEPEVFEVRPQRLEFGAKDEPVAFAGSFEAPAEIEAEEEEGEAETEEEEEEEAAPSGFRASSVADVEFEREEKIAPAPEPAAPVPEEIPEPMQTGGIEVPPRQPAPDEPPIAVSFGGGGEELEIVRDEPAAATFEARPLEDLATSPLDFMPPAPISEAAPAAPPAAAEFAPPPSEFSVARAEIPAPVAEAPPPADFQAPPFEERSVSAQPVEEAEEMGAPPMEPLPAAPISAAQEPRLEPAPSFALEEPAVQMTPPPPVTVVPPPPIPGPVAAPPAPEPVFVAPATVAAPSTPPPARGYATGDTDAFGRPKADRELVEAVADRVIEKLQGGLLDKLTRDILRPIIEALIAQELARK